MNLINQKYETDCGVPCVAMLAGVCYEEAFASIYEVDHQQFQFDKSPEFEKYLLNKKLLTRKGDITLRTTTKQLVTALKKFGLEFKDKLQICYNSDKFILPYSSIYKVYLYNKKEWHWVVIGEDRLIYDPDHNTPLKLRYKNEYPHNNKFLTSRLVAE